jgi:C-terminal processing protease CtpA/Prc
MIVCALCCLMVVSLSPVYSQSLSLDRGRGSDMLKVIKDDIKKNYYDPAFHGMDLDARFKTAEEKIKQASSVGQIFGIIAQTLIELNDSHTFFIPPQRTYRTEYGWQMQMIGEKCYVAAVKPGTDADAKGLRPGDEILSVDGRTPDRDHMWVLQYLYNALRPQAGMRLTVKGPDGKERQLDAMAKIHQGKMVINLTGDDDGSDIWNLMREDENLSRLYRHRYYEIGDQAFIWKMPQFDLPKDKVDEMMDKVRKRQALVLDLRGNGGGSIETLQRLIGNLIEQDVKLGDEKRRKEEKPLMAKTRGSNAFKGKVVVLIDSNSGSAAELLARVVQLEKRGVVIGDRSAGAVMGARHYEHKVGQDNVVFYRVSITESDLIMADGKSLEKVGVTPDEVILPTPADLAASRDPVLSHAAELVGIKLDPEKAGTLFPIEWRK